MNPQGAIAYQTSNQIGNNLQQSFSKRKDENAIESILSEAINSNDPKVLQDSIGKMLSNVSPQNQGAAIKYLEQAYNNVQQKQKQGQLREAEVQSGVTPGLTPALQVQQLKNQQPSKAAGGVSAQQVPQEYAQKIPGVLERGKDFNADELALEFLKEGIPSAFSNSYIENRRRQDEAKKPGADFAASREKAVSEYVNNAITKGEEAEDLKYTIATAKKAIGGDITGPGVQAILKNNPYSQLYVGLSPDEASLQAANKKLLEGSKGIFGSKPTEREIFLLLNSMLPSIGKTKEANLAGLGFIERINDIKLLHSQIVDELTDGGTKYIPDLERQVNARLKPISEKLRQDLEVAVKELPKEDKKSSETKSTPIKVQAPDGSKWEMTQEQIDAAKEQNVIFKPI